MANKEKSREKEQGVEMGEIPELESLLGLYWVRLPWCAPGS